MTILISRWDVQSLLESYTFHGEPLDLLEPRDLRELKDKCHYPQLELHGQNTRFKRTSDLDCTNCTNSSLAQAHRARVNYINYVNCAETHEKKELTWVHEHHELTTYVKEQTTQTTRTARSFPPEREGQSRQVAISFHLRKQHARYVLAKRFSSK